MNQTPKTAPKPANENILPGSIHTAMRDMIAVSQKLVTIAETETQKLIRNDWAGFSILQSEKEKVATKYAQISKEFRDRLSEFRSADPSLLSQLETIQNTLAQKAKSNSAMIVRMQQKAERTTQSTLIDAQTLASQKVVRFPKTETA